MIFDYVILNGKLLPANQAQISVFNSAVFSSFGIYETVKIDKGRPFYLEEHLRRLHRSANMIDLKLDVAVSDLIAWFQELAQLDSQATWTLKIIALGAATPKESAVVAMQPVPLPTYQKALYQTGASAILYEGQRFLPACKSLNTLVNFLARREATQSGALEGLLHHNGCLTEGARTNLFAVRQGQLITPPESNVLSGITRDVILQVMQHTAHPVTETSLPADIALYDEVFISSTSMHVMPITQINGQLIGTGQVGPVTQLAMNRFEAHYSEVMAGKNA